MFDISVANQQTRHAVDEVLLRDAVRAVLQDSQFTSAAVSIAVVDDDTIQELNRRYLDHDWPTDVLSFALEDSSCHLEGEIILSADTAATAGAETGWPGVAEQILYAIHGALHLIGFNDETIEEARRMRLAEYRYLGEVGCQPPDSMKQVFLSLEE